MAEPDAKQRHFIIISSALFVTYLAVALPLSVLTVHLTGVWGVNNFLAGLSVGIAFLTTILTRKMSGAMTDRLGGKAVFVRGSWCYVAGNGLCFAAAAAPVPIAGKMAVLLFGRLVLGLGEGMINTGLVSWGVGILGLPRSGRVLATVGMCMYGAVACGGPLGFALYRYGGFESVLAAAVLAPAAAIAIVGSIPSNVPLGSGKAGEPLARIIARIWKPGLCVTLHGFGFAVLGAFLSRTFIDRGWEHAGWGLGGFGFGFVVMRILIGHLPDRIGGLPVATASFVLEASGLYALWLAQGPEVALAGAFLTGAGCSMIYPALGRDVLVSVPAELRGAIIGTFAGFQDLAFGIGGPIAGFFADWFGGSVVYLVAAAAATAGLGMAVAMLSKRVKNKELR